ncbi:MAG TPA: pilus assembly protein TadG, partial [Alphaproteobacteria bacterium]|nr:pilus assembly protein TadG [Alphaproteobacteria bacterium]
MRRLHAFQGLLKRFHADERGAFFVLFGVLAIVLVATAGAVVDYTTIEQARARAQDALDSAALGLQRDIYKSGVTQETLRVKAQGLLEERLDDENVTASITGVTIDKPAGKLQLTASLTIPTAFVALVGVPEIKASVTSEATRGSVNLEVSVALDTTGSMSGQKIQDLRAATNELIDIIVQDVQEPTYTKLALVPYSQAVNVGSYANQVRGPLTGPKAISGASWSVGSAINIDGIAWKSGSAIGISAITRANPARVTTTSNHGLSTGDTVYITGVSGMTQVNGKAYVITKVNNTQFTLDGTNSSSWGTYSGSGTTQKCLVAGCPLVVTTGSNHGFSTNDYVALKGIASPLNGLNTTSTSTAWQ